MRHLDRCPICSHKADKSRLVYSRARDGLYACAGCGSLFANPRCRADQLGDLYRGQPGRGEPLNLPRQAVLAGRQLHKTVARLLLRRCPQAFGPGRRALDFGCGHGIFLDELRQAGLAALGIELRPDAAEYARTQLHLDVRTGDESALEEMDEQSFDLVTAQEVLEHALDPRRTLALLAGRLKVGGWMMLSFPNLQCWRHRLEGEHWFNIRNPTHFNFFTLRAIRDLLGELGLAQALRMVFWGGRAGFGPLRNCLQYLVRAANLGSDVRLLAQKVAHVAYQELAVSQQVTKAVART